MTTNQIADLIISDIEYREPNQRNCTIDSDDRVHIVYDLETTSKDEFGTPYVTPDEIVVSKSIYIFSAWFWVDETSNHWTEKQRKEVEDCVNEKIQ